ncbi:MAG: glycosyltransferase family 2 protein [Pseudomonadota bacterium]
MISNKNKKPKLSVIILAYNVEQYIRQALDSILMQKVNFDYEILIGNDGSTDGTVEILQQYKEKYPDLITLNITGRTPRRGPGDYINFANLYAKIRGEYFTVLDGDDYWTDENKLQKQIDFLDSNPDYTVCGHNYWFLFQDGRLEKSHDEKKDQFYTFTCNNLEELLIGGYCPYMQTSSLVYRNIFGDNQEIKKRFYHPLYRGDFIRTLLHGEKGKTKFLKDTMSVYRIITSGDWNQLGETDKIRKHLDFFLYHKKHSFDQKYAATFDQVILKYCDFLFTKKTSFFKKIRNLRYYLIRKKLKYYQASCRSR